MTDAAAIAGAELEDGFKKKIYDASQTVNDFTEKVIGQKEKVRTMSTELRRLSDELKGIAKDATGNDWFEKQHLIKRYNELKESLEQEKDALFNLTQEQATARLSVKRLRDEYALLKQEAGDGSEMFEQMKEQLVGMGKDLLKNIGIGVGIKEFIGQMVQVRGEFQEIETSLEVLLGSEEKAAKLMGEVKEFAKVSPLDLKSTAAATQMMLGFNIEAEKVPRYLQAIGDISMGNTQRFNSLTLAFSQMSATGKLMGQDLNQMINAGFNPLQIMADKTGKSIATLKEEMSKGANHLSDGTAGFHRCYRCRGQVLSDVRESLQDHQWSDFQDAGRSRLHVQLSRRAVGGSDSRRDRSHHVAYRELRDCRQGSCRTCCRVRYVQGGDVTQYRC